MSFLGKFWNRNALAFMLFLPITILALAGSSAIPMTFGWGDILQTPTVGEQSVHFKSTWISGEDTRNFDLNIDLVSVEQVNVIRDNYGVEQAVHLGQDLLLWKVTLDFHSASHEDLLGCTLMVEDGSGHRYTQSGSQLNQYGSQLMFSSCDSSGDSLEPNSAAETKRIEHFLVLPREAKPTRVIVCWLPFSEYAVLQVP